MVVVGERVVVSHMRQVVVIWVVDRQVASKVGYPEVQVEMKVAVWKVKETRCVGLVVGS